MILLDTHAWVWWVNGQPSLSRKADRSIQQAARSAGVYVSSISGWEITQLVVRGRLELTMDVEPWVAKSEGMPFLHFVPVDNAIALKSVCLPEPLHSDPADRMIIATSMILGFPLVTRDKQILDYPHVNTIW
jgi:PIN domain nuclease of toxin-antitoxin system